MVMAILSLGQIVGWGTTFYLPAVLAEDIARDLGTSRQGVLLGVTLMVAIGAVLSPTAGRLMDHYGAGPFLPMGSLLIAAGLIQFAAAASPASALVSWTLFGAAMPSSLSLAALTLITQVAGSDARRSIAVMMLFTGMASSVFWPITGALNATLGWRGAMAVFAAANGLLVLPLHGVLAHLARGRAWGEDTAAMPAAAAKAAPPPLPEGPLRRRASALLVLAFSLQGLGSWGLPLNVIAIFEHLGVASAAAVGIAALNGPATIAARLAEVAFGDRLPPIITTLIVTTLIPVAFLVLAAPIDPALAALAFTLLWFGANGVMSILRATLPLTLLGATGYGLAMGRLSLPQNLAFAAAPALYAAAFQGLGFWGGTALAGGVSLLALLAVAVLAKTIAQAKALGHCRPTRAGMAAPAVLPAPGPPRPPRSPRSPRSP
jgi:hypothetical protein